MEDNAFAAMLEPDYWYTDEDINNILKTIRHKKGLAAGMDYLLQEPVDGVHVLILDAVNGKKKATPLERNLETHLNKHIRPTTDDFMRIFHYLLSLLEGGEEDLRDKKNVVALIKGEFKREKINSDVLDAVMNVFQEYDYKPTSLRKYLSGQTYKIMGRDPFDEMAPVLAMEDNTNFRILFPLNVRESHWVLGEIEISKRGRMFVVDLSKLDPRGGGRFDENELTPTTEKAIASRLREILGEHIHVVVKKIENQEPARQKWSENSSCGVITCHDLELRAEGKPVGGPVPAGAEDLRAEQYAMVYSEAQRNLHRLD